jgi:hypothetical protein
MSLKLEFLNNLNLNFLKQNNKLKSHDSHISFYSPITSVFYEYDGKVLRPTARHSKDASLISFLPPEEITSESVEVNKFLEKDDLFDSIELKLFDELSLEPSLEYKICYSEHPTPIASNETKKYDAFLATYPAIRQRFEKLEETYIDFIFAPHLAIKSLFTKNFLSDSSTFAFIYLHNDSAYLCVYQNGNYVYSKSIRTTLKMLSDRFSETLGERIEFDDFIKIVTSLEFRLQKEEYKNGFKMILEEFFASISDILVHAKRINQISGFEAIYISTEHGNIANISECAGEYFETSFKHFDFNLGLPTEGFVDMSTKLMMFAYLHDLESYENLNFSIFSRPPALLKRPSGIFLALSTVALFVALSYPIFNLTLGGVVYGYINGSLQNELNIVKTEQNKLESAKAALLKEQSELAKRNKEETDKYAAAINMLQELDKARNGVKHTSSQIARLASVVSNSKVTIRKFDLNDSAIYIECGASEPSSITGFAKKMWLASGLKTNTNKIRQEGNASNAKFVGQILIEGNNK